MSISCIVPPELLQRLAADASAEEKRSLLATLRHDRTVRLERKREAAAPQTSAGVATGKPNRSVYDQNGVASDVPATLVRAEGAPATKDVAVNEAYDGLGATFNFFLKVFGWDSIDGQGLPLQGLVHYGTNYDNAFWNGRSMVFGDGDGKLFVRFTKSLDVIAHELTHGVTENTLGLKYSGQSGALNESVSDVFGSMVKQIGRASCRERVLMPV